MVLKKKKQIIVSKEDAVFWMDEKGRWTNEHGIFEHPKIIKYFNASIKKDKNGYYVHQTTDEYDEKVYFPYEDTVLFITDIKMGSPIILIMNNSEKIALDPQQLFTKKDNLYVQTSEHIIKFGERALLKISKFMEEKQGQLFFIMDKKASLVQSETRL